MNPALLAFLPARSWNRPRRVPAHPSASHDPRRRRPRPPRRRQHRHRQRRRPQPGFERAGSWLHQHLPNLPGLSGTDQAAGPAGDAVAKFYGEKLQLAVFGFLAPLVLPFLFQLFTGHFFALPLLLSPVVALILWNSRSQRPRTGRRPRNASSPGSSPSTSSSSRSRSSARSTPTTPSSPRERLGFVGVQAHPPRVPVAELSRVSKWDALARLGDEVDVPALVEMARMMRLARSPRRAP